MKKTSILLFACFAVVMMLFGKGCGCGPKYPDCENDGHCKEHGEYCVDKKCRKCRDDSHCNAANKCKICDSNTYTCEHRPGCCMNDLDCPNGRCWISVGQETGNCGPQCKSDADCPPDQYCEVNVCRPKAECKTDGDCGPDEECVNGKCEKKKTCQLEPIYFDFDEYAIRTDAKQTLDQNGECLKKTGNSIQVQGNCDERGSNEYNLALGERRANAAKNYLSSMGVDSGKMSTISYGEERPQCTDSGETCWQKNRRSDFVVK